MGIEASAKGLLAGANLTRQDTIEFMQLPSCFVNVRDPRELIDFDYLAFVLVVEKETVFTHLI